MEITFTKEELTEFAKALKSWANRRSDFVMRRFMENAQDMKFHNRGGPIDLYEKYVGEFESHNPEPDWRSFI